MVTAHNSNHPAPTRLSGHQPPRMQPILNRVFAGHGVYDIFLALMDPLIMPGGPPLNLEDITSEGLESFKLPSRWCWTWGIHFAFKFDISFDWSKFIFIV